MGVARVTVGDSVLTSKVTGALLPSAVAERAVLYRRRRCSSPLSSVADEARPVFQCPPDTGRFGRGHRRPFRCGAFVDLDGHGFRFARRAAERRRACLLVGVGTASSVTSGGSVSISNVRDSLFAGRRSRARSAPSPAPCRSHPRAPARPPLPIRPLRPPSLHRSRLRCLSLLCPDTRAPSPFRLRSPPLNVGSFTFERALMRLQGHRRRFGVDFERPRFAFAGRIPERARLGRLTPCSRRPAAPARPPLPILRPLRRPPPCISRLRCLSLLCPRTRAPSPSPLRSPNPGTSVC